MGDGVVEQDIRVEDLKGCRIFPRIGRPICIHVDLDAVVHNTNLMRKHCRNPDVGIMAVLKSDCYGHGAVQIGRHLLNTGAAERLAVATVAEGVVLRKSGRIHGPIHIFGNVQGWEMARCVQHSLIPSVSDVTAVHGMAQAMKGAGIDHQRNKDQSGTTANGRQARMCHAPPGAVHIKLDTGMRRNGCQPADVPAIVQACDDSNVPLEGIFSHIANFHDKDFTNEQLKVFDDTTDPYKERGILLHIAAAGPALHDQGSHYDMIRPGITLLGMPPDDNYEDFAAMGFKPTLEVKGTPTLLKYCPPGSPIGYGCAYRCKDYEWIATFPVGYADGYWRDLSCKGQCVRRDKTGEICLVVGKISMDAILVRLPSKPADDEVFTIITADFHPDTSFMSICRKVGTIPQEALARLAPRIPRVFTSQINGTVEILEAYGLRDELDHCRNVNQVFACPKCRSHSISSDK